MAEIKDLYVDEAHAHIERYHDAETWARIERAALAGVDLTDVSKSQTDFFKNFVNRHKTVNAEKKRVRISKEKALYLKDAFENEIGRIVGKRRLSGG